MAYKRILLKLSGEALMGEKQYGIDPGRMEQYIQDISEAHKMGVQIGIVIGGGNIFRGMSGAEQGFDRIQGDYMGMLATVINSLALQSTLKSHNIESKVFSGIAIDPIAESMTSRKAISNLEEGKIVIISGGTGNPFFTTDTASALRALEIKADAILKGTRVDGVYTDNPEKNPEAKKYDTISYDEAIEKNLRVMDQTAFSLCKENKLPIVVFNMNTKGNLQKLLKGEKLGTLVTKK